MKTIFIVGASIGFSVGLAMARLPGIETSFRIVNLCKKGAKFPELVWPKFSEVGENDILLIFPFGNDLQTGFWYKDYTLGRQFHLREFVKLEQSVMESYYAELTARILKYQGKITLVTCFYRFLCTCHKHPGLVAYYKERNSELISEFSKYDKVTVLDHRTLVSEQVYRAKRDIKFYASLLHDQVHFKDNSVIAKRIFATFQ